MRFNPILLVQMSEKEKKLLITLTIVIILLFVLFGLIYESIRSLMRRQAKVVDSYMYELCKYKVITKPTDFVNYVFKRETKTLYCRCKNFLRLAILLFFFTIWYYSTFHNGSFETIFTALDRLTFSLNWTYTTIFNSITIIDNWPTISKYPNPLLTVDGYVVYISLLVSIWILFGLISSTIAFIARISRSKKVSVEVFAPNLDEVKFNG